MIKQINIITVTILTILLLVFVTNRLSANAIAQEQTTTTGAIIESISDDELRDFREHKRLYSMLPVVGNNFAIDYDFINDVFRVVLLSSYSTSRSNFNSWRSNNNFNSLPESYFEYVEYTHSNSSPVMISVFPYLIYPGISINLYTVVMDEDGASDIDRVYFGFSPCSQTEAPAYSSNFERRFSNYFGAFYSASEDWGGMARLNPSNDCTSASGELPWEYFTGSSNINIGNKNGSATLKSVSTQTGGKLLKITWNVDFSDSFPKGIYNYYYMARDLSHIWHTGSGSTNWPRLKAVTIKSPPPPIVTVVPTDIPTQIPTNIPTDKPTGVPTDIPTSTPSPKPGDANSDGRVDGIDYVIWLNHFGMDNPSGAQDGDFNSDDKVDGIDYVIWLLNVSF